MIPARRSAFPASLLGSSALLLLAFATVRCASDDDLDLMGPSSGGAGTGGASAGAGGTSAGSGTAGQSGGQAGSGASAGQGGNLGVGGKAGAAGSATIGGQGGSSGAGAGSAGTAGTAGEGGTDAGGEGGTEGGGAGGGEAGEGGSSGAAGSAQAGAGGSGPTGCCLSNADCPTLPFQQICAEGVCLAPPIGIPVPNSCWADSECSAQRPKCVAESVCGCGEAGCNASKDKRGTCVQGSCCAADDDCEGAQRCTRPDGQGGFGRCSPPPGDAACYVNSDCKGAQKCSGQKACACGDAGCTPKPGKCG